MALPAVMLIVATGAVAPPVLALHGLPPVDLSTAARGGVVGLGLLSTFAATAFGQYGAARVEIASAGVIINIGL
jgi:hypothetical protein